MGFLDSLRGSRQFNQNDTGLAANVAGRTGDVYSNGISEADMYKLAMADKARKENDYKAAMGMIAKNREYNTAVKNDAIASQPKYETFDDGNGNISSNEIYNPSKYRTIEDGDGGLTFEEIQPSTTADQRTILKYKDNVDPGLAAKYAADRAAFR